MSSFFLSIYLGVELLGHMVTLGLTSEEIARLFSKWLYNYGKVLNYNFNFFKR